MAVQMVKVRCPYCGATFEVPKTVSVTVCPYCGTAIWIDSGEKVAEHYMYPDKTGFNRAFKNALGIAERQYPAPADLAETATPKGGRLHFIPLYIYHIKVVAECPKKEESGIEEDWTTLSAVKKLPLGLSSTYRFALGSRRYFEPRRLERGVYHQPEVSPERYIKKVSKKARGRAKWEASCSRPKIKDETRWEGIVHYPFWEIVYEYGGREYKALVDAVDGSVVYVEYPIEDSKKKKLLIGGSGFLLFPMGLGAYVGYKLGMPIIGTVSAAFTGAPGAFIYWTIAFSERGKYRLKSRLKKQ